MENERIARHEIESRVKDSHIARLEELLYSAAAIAADEGRNANWEEFIKRLAHNGIVWRKPNEPPVRCYSFDWGDQKLILRATDPLHSLVDIMTDGGGTIELTVEVINLTPAEIAALPEWGN